MFLYGVGQCRCIAVPLSLTIYYQSKPIKERQGWGEQFSQTSIILPFGFHLSHSIDNFYAFGHTTLTHPALPRSPPPQGYLHRFSYHFCPLHFSSLTLPLQHTHLFSCLTNASPLPHHLSFGLVWPVYLNLMHYHLCLCLSVCLSLSLSWHNYFIILMCMGIYFSSVSLYIFIYCKVFILFSITFIEHILIRYTRRSI